MGSLIKSEKYGRQTEIKSERQRDKNKDNCWFQRLDKVGICSVASLGEVKASLSSASKGCRNQLKANKPFNECCSAITCYLDCCRL